MAAKADKFQAPRGTNDILPEQQVQWQRFYQVAQKLATRFSYGRIDTPTLEHSELFRRGVGEGTDIVTKEMYQFIDQGGVSLTLRPEGTAAVCRAYIEHGMYNQLQPVRLYYTGPMYRHERPQSGRYRQFHQFGVEAIGNASPEVDAEVIELAWVFLQKLGIKDVTLRINSIGDAADQEAYSQALLNYYLQHVSDLTEVERERLKRAPLRMLDAKQGKAKELANNAPHSLDYIKGEAQQHFATLLQLLGQLKDVLEGFEYVVDYTLVRGLDYYNRTVFEIEPRGAHGQTTLIGGGRYDPLIEMLYGPSTPGVGFAAGAERIIQTMQQLSGNAQQELTTTRLHTVIVMTENTLLPNAYRLAAQLRANGVHVIIAPYRSLKAQFKYADRTGAASVILLGREELEREVVNIKPLYGLTGNARQMEVAVVDIQTIASLVTKYANAV